jgi:hypothetical protein
LPKLDRVLDEVLARSDAEVPLVVVLLGAARAALRTHTDLALEYLSLLPGPVRPRSLLPASPSRRGCSSRLCSFVQLPRRAPSFDPAAATSFNS